jgi:hypothetical protein
VVSIIERILCNLLCRPGPAREEADGDAGPADTDAAAKDRPTKEARRTGPRGGARKPT